jgi:hypothetical protein
VTSGSASVVAGGFCNSIGSFGICTTIGGGFCNTANGCNAFIGGGRGNSAANIGSISLGGCLNTTSGDYSNILGGRGNSIVVGVGGNPNCAVIAGGSGNQVNSITSFIGGGVANLVSPCGGVGVVGGGCTNLMCGRSSAILGGAFNTIFQCGFCSNILGGLRNGICTPNSTISGGYCNFIHNSTSVNAAFGSFIGGGVGNQTTGGTWNNTTNVWTVAPSSSNAGKFITIGGGFQNRVNCDYGVVAGGDSNVVCNTNSAVLGGSRNTSTGLGASVIGGVCNTASGNYSVASGNRSTASQRGERAHSSFIFAAVGDAQQEEYILGNKTTDATPANLFLDGTAATQRLLIASGTALQCTVMTFGIRSDGAQVASSYRYVVIKNVGGTTSIVHQSNIGQHFDAVAYAITISADDVNDALQIEVTGAVGETLRWVSYVTGNSIVYGV